MLFIQGIFTGLRKESRGLLKRTGMNLKNYFILHVMLIAVITNSRITMSDIILCVLSVNAAH